MKRFKRLAALTCVGTMLVSQVVPAFAGDSTVNGNVGVENDNSSLSGVYDVVLPASETTAYDFTIDPDGLLGIYSQTTSVLDSVLFKTTTAATVKANVGAGEKMAGNQFIVEGYKEETDTSNLKTLFTDKGLEDVDSLLSADVNDYAVWVPVTTEEGIAAAKGEFKRIEDLETLQKYATLELTAGKITDVIMKGTPYDTTTGAVVGNDNSNLIGENIFDGQLYKKGNIEITKIDGTSATGYDLMDYINVDSEGTIEFVADSQERELKVMKTSDSTVTTPTLDDTYVTYIPASTSYASTSDDIVITNKSLGSVAVSVDVNVNTDSGLGFSTTDDFSGAGDDKKDLYLGLLAGSSAKTKVEQKTDKDGNILSCKTSATFAVAGVADAGSIKYQGTDDDRDEATNSHNYHTYVTNDSKPSSLKLNLKVAINSFTDWAAYVKKLRGGEAVRPTPSFVFAFNEDLGQMKKDNATKYSNDKVEYTVDGDNMVTATTLYYTAEEVGLTEEGSNYKFTLPVEVPMITVATSSIASSAVDKGNNNVSVKLSSTADSNEITFPASALKGKEGVKITIVDTTVTDKYETTNTTYVISVN